MLSQNNSIILNRNQKHNSEIRKYKYLNLKELQ